MALAQSQRSYNARILKKRRFFIAGDGPAYFSKEFVNGPADFLFLGVRPNFRKKTAPQISCLWRCGPILKKMFARRNPVIKNLVASAKAND